MSAPRQEFRESEYLGLGLLAVTSTGLLDRILAGEQLDGDDKHTLRQATSFLHDVSSGAKLVTAGVTSNVSAAESVRKLAYAVEPLGLMQRRIKEAEVGDVLNRVANTIEHSLQTPPTVNERNDLEMAKDFFQQLQAFLLNLVESGKRRTGDLGSAFNAARYAI